MPAATVSSRFTGEERCGAKNTFAVGKKPPASW
jgi:hypothetical protein